MVSVDIFLLSDKNSGENASRILSDLSSGWSVENESGRSVHGGRRNEANIKLLWHEDALKYSRLYFL